jgi:hypothetical protein
MIAWFVAAALAQNDCLSSSAYPVAGTTGYRNAVTALRTNAVTYAATSFAEREVFPIRNAMREPNAPKAVVVYEFNNLFNAAKTPMMSFSEDCPVDRRFATHPVDLIGANLGGVFRYKRFGAYYAAGFTVGAPSSRDRFQRYAGAIAGYPAASAPPLLFAPLIGNQMVLSGNSAMAIDSLGGVVIDAEIAELRAGWTATRGLHVSVADPRFGLYGNAILNDGLSEVGQFEAGARRFRPGGAVGEKVGSTSLFGRGLPLTEASERDGERFAPEQLLTGHFVQDSIAGVLDVAAAYALAPTPQLFEGRIGLHSKGFHDIAVGDFTEPDPDATDPDAPAPDPNAPADEAFLFGYLVQGGVVQLPDQWYYGVEGGARPQIRLEMSAGSAKGAFHATIMMNEPEVLALYPFAVRAVHYRVAMRGRF